MEVFTNINNINIEHSAICVGTFDGLHLGHNVVIGETIKQAKKLGVKSLVFTFWPHPLEIIQPEKKVYYLNTFQEKIDLFSKSGIDYLVLFPFNKDFASKSSKEFIKDFLVEKLKMKFFVIGYDHQFGKGRKGKYEKVIDCGKELGFSVKRIEQQAVSEEFISSTKIRDFIKTGRVNLANKLLGYQYFISGEVEKGLQIGTKIGFPTANIKIAPNKIMPQIGVYAVEVEIRNNIYKAMANLGFKPTLNNEKKLSLEVHIFNFKEDLYSTNIKVSFCKKMRDEIKFNNLEDLKNQIQKDKKIISDYFNKI